MWGEATVHVHKSGSGPYSEPTVFDSVRQTVSSCDIVFSIAQAVWRSKSNLAFRTDFTNDWEIETTHWQNTHSSSTNFGSQFPTREDSGSCHIYKCCLLIWPRSSTAVFQWATKGAKPNRTLNANSQNFPHSALCIDTHTKQDWINMGPHDRTV